MYVKSNIIQNTSSMAILQLSDLKLGKLVDFIVQASDPRPSLSFVTL